jgi:lipid A 3-O-deacylase
MFRLFLMLALLAMPTQRALALERPPEGSEVQLFIENDLLARTDRYYTNGIKFGGGMGFDLLQLPAAEFLRQVAPEAAARSISGSFSGQNLYTPRAIGVSQAQPLDRPWAAWLYLGGVAQRARDNRLDTVEIDLGLVGPSAWAGKSSRAGTG